MIAATDARATPVTGEGIPFTRLVAVELRKFFDTLLGRLLLAATVLLGVGIMAASALFRGPELMPSILITGAVLSTLLPALGALAVTAEWSHGTVVPTFTLEPRRARVVLAKCLPPVVATLGACLLMLLIAPAVVAAVSGAAGASANWTVDPSSLVGWLLVNVMTVLSGVALGALTLNAPASIVIVVASTAAWNFVAFSSETGATIAAWFDLARTTAPLLDDWSFDPTALAQLAVSLLVWVALPLALGIARVSRQEVR